MILAIISLATILSFATWMYLPKASLRYTLGTLSLLTLLASTLYLTNHFVNHTGMTVETTVSKKNVYSAADKNASFGLLIYQKVGSKSNHHVLVYKDAKDQKQPRAHFIPNAKKINEAIKKTARYKEGEIDQAYLKTTTKRYVWKSDFDKLMFGFGGENGQLISQKSIVTVPKDTWLVLTKEQAAKLSQLAPQMKAQQEKAMKANPQLAMKLQSLAQNDPKALTIMQVAEIKKALGITK